MSSWMPGLNGSPSPSRKSRRSSLLQAVIVRPISCGASASENVPAGADRSSGPPELGCVRPSGYRSS